MFDKIILALNEALDITLHLQPLKEQFTVIIRFYNLGIVSKIHCQGAGKDGLSRHKTALPTLDAHHLPGVRQQQVLQLHGQDHCPHAGGRTSHFLLEVYNIHPFQETCNLLIDMTRKFLDPLSIFQIEVKL